MWQELQPDATFLEIPEAGHMLPLERPQMLAEAILDFLRLLG
jgi:pimeloyl-ACP methyl ester carboxylesterase